MIVDNMNYREIGQEILSDWWQEASSVAFRLLGNSEYRRAVLKKGQRDKLLFFKPKEITTGRGNRFIVVPFSNGKNNFKKEGLHMIVYLMFQYRNEKLIARIVNRFNTILFFKQHLLKRYFERFKREMHNLSLEYVTQFFKDNLLMNSEYTLGAREDSNCICKIRDGILFGQDLGDEHYLFRTFISTDMAKGQQVDSVERLSEELEGRYGTHWGNC